MGAGGGFVAGDVKNYPGKVTRHVVNACVLGAMGGLIFGYDLGISGGVTSMAPFLNKFFPDVYRKEALDTSTNQYCRFNDMGLTLFTSSLYLAALIASFGASYITRTWGRKRTMLLGGIVFFIGAALNAGAVDLSMLIAGRILLGVGVGFSTQVISPSIYNKKINSLWWHHVFHQSSIYHAFYIYAKLIVNFCFDIDQSVPLYVSEMAPQQHRGAFNIVFQLAITIGIFIANLVNYLTPKIAGNQAWRYSLGGATIPAALICLSALKLDDTPNSLLEQGKAEKAREILRKIRGLNDKEIESEFQDLVTASEAAKQVEHPWTRILKRQYRPQLTMAVAIPFFQQLTGMNVVMFYAPVLLQSIGFESNASLLSTVITGAVNILATGVSIYGSDKSGRRSLFLSGGAVMFVFQVNKNYL
jgi:MFS family permease